VERQLLVPCLALFFAPQAIACTCVTATNARASMSDSSVVFRGTVLERKTLPIHPEMKGRGRYAITFRVEEYWKGSPARTLTLYGLDSGTDCLDGGDYEVGKNYLVYAVEREVEDVMLDEFFWYGWTDVLPKGSRMLKPQTACVPGGETSRVGHDLGQLGKGRVPPESRGK
jgi:hypothetical protein